MNFKKMAAVITAGAVLAFAEPVVSILSDVLSTTVIAEDYDESGLQIVDGVLVSASEDVTDVVIPDGVTAIGNNAFSNCSNLTSVTIPKSVTEIGGSAFSPSCEIICTSGSYAETYANENGYTFTVVSFDTLDDNTDQSSVTEQSFSNDTPTIAETVEALSDVMSVTADTDDYDENGLQIVDGVLVGASKDVTDVVIPDGVTEIGSWAFCDCTSLTSVTIGNSVTEIGSYAFCDCTSLTSVTIGNSVTEIGSSAFSGCTSLTSATYKGKTYDYEHIGELYDTITYGESGLVINDGVLTGVSKYLTEVVIPNSVTQIGDSAFMGCSSLTSVTIGNSVTEIGKYAFEGCKSLSSVTIGNSVTEIGDYAFSSCSSLISVTIPASVTKISKSAFLSDTKTGDENQCSSLMNINVEDGNEKYYSEDGFLLERLDDGGIFLHSCPGGREGEVTIPNGVTEIGENVFAACTSITSVIIPDGVVSIGARAFCRCNNLESVTIPGSVTTIGGSAFNVSIQGGSITNIIILDGMTEIGDYAFYGANPVNITIPDSVTRIGHGAFWLCSSLKSITIPASVTEIAEDAFFSWLYNSFLEEINGIPGSYAETFAKENGYTFNDISETPTQPTTPVETPTSPTAIDQTFNDATTDITVEGGFPEGTTLSTEMTKVSDSQYNFEITLTDKAGNKVQPDGKATVKIPLPETLKNAVKLFVYRLENGEYIHYSSTVVNGYVVFETDHFSTYIITTDELTNTDSTEDDNPDTGITLAAIPVIIAAGAAVLVVRRKRK